MAGQGWSRRCLQDSPRDAEPHPWLQQPRGFGAQHPVLLGGWPRSPRCFRRLWSRRWKRRTRTLLANAFLGPGSEREAPAFISSSSGFVNKVEGKSRKAAVSKVQALGEGAAERIRGCRDQTKSGQTFPQLPPAFILFFILED